MDIQFCFEKITKKRKYNGNHWIIYKSMSKYIFIGKLPLELGIEVERVLDGTLDTSSFFGTCSLFPPLFISAIFFSFHFLSAKIGECQFSCLHFILVGKEKNNLQLSPPIFIFSDN
ncbi:hypothetical protein PP707_00375 [Acetobacter pasteurianus]|nr:hypothetical protein [Acetobacter pasteurianus]